MSSETNSSTSSSNNSEACESSIWKRGLYMLLFVIISRLAELLVGIVALVQFILKASTNNTNDNLTSLGKQLSQYMFEIIQFQTFNSEEKPFPFKSWPDTK